MKTRCAVTGILTLVLLGARPGISGSNPNSPTLTQTIVTVLPVPGITSPSTLEPSDFSVHHGNTPAHISGVERLSGDQADMQLFILLDDSTRSASLGTQLGELKTFLSSLPPSMQVGVGYMRNGTVATMQSFTTDHQKAAAGLRLPMAVPGENGSPYFVLTDLAKHWPSKETTRRRVVLMLTDGVDPYYGTSIIDDPYVDTAMHEALKDGVMVYSIYLRGAGLYGNGSWVTTTAQSRLSEVSKETGGNAYFQGMTDPVSISPFLKDFEDRLDHQYKLTIEAWSSKGVQPVKVRTELPGVKIEAPSQIYVR